MYCESFVLYTAMYCESFLNYKWERNCSFEIHYCCDKSNNSSLTVLKNGIREGHPINQYCILCEREIVRVSVDVFNTHVLEDVKWNSLLYKHLRISSGKTEIHACDQTKKFLISSWFYHRDDVIFVFCYSNIYQLRRFWLQVTGHCGSHRLKQKAVIWHLRPRGYLRAVTSPPPAPHCSQLCPPRWWQRKTCTSSPKSHCPPVSLQTQRPARPLVSLWPELVSSPCLGLWENLSAVSQLQLPWRNTTAGGLHDRNVDFSQFWGLEVWDHGAGEGSVPDLQMAAFPLCVHMVARERQRYRNKDRDI